MYRKLKYYERKFDIGSPVNIRKPMSLLVKMKNKVGLISLGCEKNRIDAEHMLWDLQRAGYKIVPCEYDADVVIINTCGFIDDAKRESIDEIFNMIRLKDEKKSFKVIVTGCLSQRYKEEILKDIPEVDAVLGIGANGDIVDIVKKIIDGETVESFPNKEDLSLEGGRVRTTPNHYAYLKISDGCDNKCTYCAIPLIRGEFRSRPIENIIEEAKKLAESGVKELILIAQDTTRYGEDLYNKPFLATLLKELCKIEDIKWIRILYCYPDRITDELIDVIACEEKILNYIDIPLQHCSREVLKNMNRNKDAQSLKDLIWRIRAKIPDVILRTTLIVGFPGETEKDFSELMEFVNDIKFDRLGCFAYSREEDTKAFDMPNQVEDDVKERRREAIMRRQLEIMEENCQKPVGKLFCVLVEEFSKDINKWVGRSYMDAPDVDGKIIIENIGNKPINAGDLIQVKITGFYEYDLLADVI